MDLEMRLFCERAEGGNLMKIQDSGRPLSGVIFSAKLLGTEMLEFYFTLHTFIVNLGYTV